LERKSVKGVKLRIHGGEKITHQAYNILKNLQRKKVIKPPMSKTLKKIDGSNEETNQMSDSEKSRE